jgi:hypothetical protein
MKLHDSREFVKNKNDGDSVIFASKVTESPSNFVAQSHCFRFISNAVSEEFGEMLYRVSSL